MKEAILRSVFRRIEKSEDAVLLLEKNLIENPAISPENGGKGEYNKAKFLNDYFKSRNINVERYDAIDPGAEKGIRPNLIVNIKGDSSRRFCVISHLDVVPEGDRSNWDSDPFKLKVDGRRIIGRGSEDNNHGAVASIIAAMSILEEEIIPSKSIMLCFVADEENGSKYGIYHLIEEKLFKEDDMVLVPDSGSKDGSIIEVAEKTILWLKFEIIGRQCHASRPEYGINATRAAAQLIVKLDELSTLFPREDKLFIPSMSTFSVTRREENVQNINTIPGRDVFYMDCRVLPCYDALDVIEKIKIIVSEIEKSMGVKINVDIVHKEESAGITDSESDIVKTLKEAVVHVNGIDPKLIGIGGGTVANILRRENIATAIYSKIDETAHNSNEYTNIDNIINDAKVMAYCFLKE